jgi:hypothetical protein
MEIKQLDQIITSNSMGTDSMDLPDCFGDFNRTNKICAKYCAISIRCCVQYNKNPKIDLLEKLLIQNQYAIKLH